MSPGAAGRNGIIGVHGRERKELDRQGGSGAIVREEWGDGVRITLAALPLESDSESRKNSAMRHKNLGVVFLASFLVWAAFAVEPLIFQVVASQGFEP